MPTKEKLDVRDEIMNWLEANQRSLRWLSTQAGIKYGTMYSIFSQKTIMLSEEKLKCINTATKQKFKL